MPYNVIFSEYDDGPLQNKIRDIILNTLDYLNYENKNAYISISCVTPYNIQQLNKQYRNVDIPTNVLSFPNSGDVLGDVVLCLDIVKKEAEDQQKTFDEHLTHLVVHSILHLLGYDHIAEDEAVVMEEKEIDILGNLFKIANPYV